MTYLRSSQKAVDSEGVNIQNMCENVSFLRESHMINFAIGCVILILYCNLLNLRERVLSATITESYLSHATINLKLDFLLE